MFIFYSMKGTWSTGNCNRYDQVLIVLLVFLLFSCANSSVISTLEKKNLGTFSPEVVVTMIQLFSFQKGCEAQKPDSFLQDESTRRAGASGTTKKHFITHTLKRHMN